jgi:hypothetical protein
MTCKAWGNLQKEKIKPSVRTADVPAKIWTEQLSSTSLEHYLQTNLYGLIWTEAEIPLIHHVMGPLCKVTPCAQLLLESHYPCHFLMNLIYSHLMLSWGAKHDRIGFIWTTLIFLYSDANIKNSSETS